MRAMWLYNPRPTAHVSQDGKKEVFQMPVKKAAKKPAAKKPAAKPKKSAKR
jgi:hypothetical protein